MTTRDSQAVRRGSFLGGAALALVLASAGVAAQAQPGSTPARPLIAGVFSDHMVLQRDRPIHLWGAAAPGATISVSLRGAAVSTRAGGAGRWDAELPAMAAGGPYEVTVRGADGQSQTLRDVLVGDVWLCSGQSNMEFSLQHVTNAVGEVSSAANPAIRLLQIPHVSRTAPADSLNPTPPWRAAAPNSAANFSAVCFIMGRELQKATGAPVGLIDASWGGSPVQDWISARTVRRLGGYDDPLGILDRYSVSPEEGQKAWGQFMNTWWSAHDTDGGAKLWTSTGFDDHDWPTMVPDRPWEKADIPALANFDGLVWYRTWVDVPAAKAGQAATLTLGPIDDMDTSWVNGQAVGADDVWNTPRRYPVPAGVLKAGRNLVTVRVLDTSGGGGMWGPPSDRALVFADGSKIALPAAWRYKVSSPISALGAAPRQPWVGGNGLTTLYNGMIAPLAGMRIRGAAWYQGEANVAEPQAYARLLPGLIGDWREAFRDPAMPFLVVQLANFGQPASKPEDSPWAALREVQRRTVAADPHAGLALAIDVGQPYDIHPTDKQDVGHRLSLAARRVSYGEKVVDAGPTPVSARREGGRVAISYAPGLGRLVVYSAARPIGFELCDAAAQCRYVDATVQGDGVVLDTPQGMTPVKVRYLWADSPVVNLYGPDGLPAPPFEMAVQ